MFGLDSVCDGLQPNSMAPNLPAMASNLLLAKTKQKKGRHICIWLLRALQPLSRILPIPPILHLPHGHRDILALVAQSQHPQGPQTPVAAGWHCQEGVLQHLMDLVPLVVICIAILAWYRMITWLYRSFYII